MFEIKNEATLFRLSFIERIEEPEEPQEDEIRCWLEIEGCGINLQCQCELTPCDLTSLKEMISGFYASLSRNESPEPVSFAPRIETFTCGFNAILGSDSVGFTFSASPQVYDSWKLTGGIIIDQSYFPALIYGIESILTN
ncbi:hypothetical protein ACFFJN_20765 [Erwinia mallotivora]|uniref:hypothetical protein n=1 Tax=Erwinia mallotivora TaxID=69222 RepID=UPI0035ED49F4